MNEHGVFGTLAEKDSPELKQYQLPTFAGKRRLRLDYKAWYKVRGLQCYFTDINNGEKVLLYAWGVGKTVNGKPKNVYKPAKSEVDFSLVTLGSVWDCEIVLNSKGNLTWKTASAVS